MCSLLTYSGGRKKCLYTCSSRCAPLEFLLMNIYTGMSHLSLMVNLLTAHEKPWQRRQQLSACHPVRQWFLANVQHNLLSLTHTHTQSCFTNLEDSDLHPLIYWRQLVIPFSSTTCLLLTPTPTFNLNFIIIID